MANEWVLIHGGALGDLILSIQLALRARSPLHGGRLTVLSRTDPGDLAACTPAIDRRSLDGLNSHWLYATDSGPPPAVLWDALAGHPVLNALGNDAGPVHRRLLECGVRRVFSFDPRPRDGGGHITTQWQRDLERQGLLLGTCIYAGRDATAIVPDRGLVERGRESLRDAGANSEACILIHPGSGGRDKCWPLEGFLDVARKLETAGRSTAVVIGPVELERWPADSIAMLSDRGSLCMPRDTGELASILAAGAALVSNDSGPAHLAALLGAPTVTLFGPTQAKKWRPLGSRARALQGNVGAGTDWGLPADEVVRLACMRQAG